MRVDKVRRKARSRELEGLMFQLKDQHQEVRELLEIRLEEAKEGMVVCPPNDLPRLQGSAIAFDSLLSDLLISKAKIQPKEPKKADPNTIELY